MENDNLSTPLDYGSTSGTGELAISSEMAGYLLEASKWGKFLSIVGFVMIGLVVIMALFAGSLLSAFGNQTDMPFPSFVITIIYIFIAALYFFPLYYLYNYSVKMKSAIRTKDNGQMTIAFKNHKSLYKFMGVFTAIFLGFYALIFISSMLIGASSFF